MQKLSWKGNAMSQQFYAKEILPEYIRQMMALEAPFSQALLTFKRMEILRMALSQQTFLAPASSVMLSS